jgi:hypothetical protein
MNITINDRADGFGAQYQHIIFGILYADIHNNTYIHKPITQMSHNYENNPNFINEIEEFKQFKEENKLFYETILSENMDMNIYRQMMKMKRKLESGEDQYSVDVKFGKYMAEKFVDPVVKNIPKKN